MGTRADFYVGVGKTAEWIGSIAWDGYPDGPHAAKVLPAKSEDEFRQSVADLIKAEDGTTPAEGWPWPWDDSCTTDYAYCFDDDKIRVFCFGRECSGAEFEIRADDKSDFPNMADVKNVQLGTRGGIIMIG